MTHLSPRNCRPCRLVLYGSEMMSSEKKVIDIDHWLVDVKITLITIVWHLQDIEKEIHMYRFHSILLYHLTRKNLRLPHQLEDHQDTSPKPSSFTQPITCITDGKFSSGGSPMEDDDLLRTTQKKSQWQSEKDSWHYLGRIAFITCWFGLTFDQRAAGHTSVVNLGSCGCLHTLEACRQPSKMNCPNAKPNL